MQSQHGQEGGATGHRWDAVSSGWNKWSQTQLGALQPISDRLVELAQVRPGVDICGVALHGRAIAGFGLLQFALLKINIP